MQVLYYGHVLLLCKLKSAAWGIYTETQTLVEDKYSMALNVCRLSTAKAQY